MFHLYIINQSSISKVNSGGFSLLSENHKRFSFSSSHFPTSNDDFIFKHVSIEIIMCSMLLARHD